MHEFHGEYGADPNAPVIAAPPEAVPEPPVSAPASFPGTEAIEPDAAPAASGEAAKPSRAERRAARRAEVSSQALGAGRMPWDTRVKLAVVLSFVVLVGVLIVNRTRGKAKADAAGEKTKLLASIAGSETTKPKDATKGKAKPKPPAAPAEPADEPPLPDLSERAQPSPQPIESPPIPSDPIDEEPVATPKPKDQSPPPLLDEPVDLVETPRPPTPTPLGAPPETPPASLASDAPPPLDAAPETLPEVDEPLVLAAAPGIVPQKTTTPASSDSPVETPPATSEPLPPVKPVSAPVDLKEKPSKAEPLASPMEAEPKPPQTEQVAEPIGAKETPLSLPTDLASEPGGVGSPGDVVESEKPVESFPEARIEKKGLPPLSTPPPTADLASEEVAEPPKSADGMYDIPSAGLTRTSGPSNSARAAAGGVVPAPSTATLPGTVAPVAGTIHVVRRGENFWTISRYHYASGRFYKALWDANRDVAKTPEDLYVGTTIRIPPVDDLNRSLIEPPRTASSAAEANGSRRDAKTERASTRPEEPTALPVAGPARRPLINRPAPASPAYRTYVVRRSETLRSIARAQLGDPDREDEIYQLNRESFDGESYRVEAGMALKIPNETSRR